MSDSQYNFWKLASEYLIEVPMIQRDYAQGRNEGSVPYIRKNILTALESALVDEKRLDLDFVYGRIEKHGDNSHFIPIDGQQRITTLFLLHWYLASKDGVASENEEVLGRFSYATRNSSTAFCKALTEHACVIPAKEEDLSKQITDECWFVAAWQQDPTVASMLVMLNAIHDRFAGYSGLFVKLTDQNDPPVTFQFTEMQQLGLTDKVYIKMNSRGKSLTEFENFKALFEGFLENSHHDRKKEFAQKVDGIWTDLFWGYAMKDVAAQTKKQIQIDSRFMNVFTYITKLLYYRGYEGDAEKFVEFSKQAESPDYWKKLYTKSENIDFLFSTLDFFSSLPDPRSFFDSIFSGNSFVEGHVALFHEETDLLRRCMDGRDFNIAEEILLYLIIAYMSVQGRSACDGELHDRLRVLRNRLERVRQLNWPKYSPNLRYENMAKYLGAADDLAELEEPVYEALNSGKNLYLFPRDTLQAEVDKAAAVLEGPAVKNILHRIEDDPLFKGTIHAIFSVSNHSDLERLYDTFCKVFSFDSSLVVRALLTTDYKGIMTGDSGIGQKWYLGSGKPAHWHTILTFDGVDIIQFLSMCSPLFSVMPPAEALNQLIEQWLTAKGDINSWKYYFIKYKGMTSGNINQFAKQEKSPNFEMRKMFTATARGYHINPYVQAVASMIDNSKICSVNDCYSLGYDFSPLVLKNGITLTSEEAGWRIAILDGLLASSWQFPGLEPTDKTTEFLLKQTPEKDRIVIALDFISSIFPEVSVCTPTVVGIAITASDLENQSKPLPDSWKIMKLTEWQGWHDGKMELVTIESNGTISHGVPQATAFHLFWNVDPADLPTEIDLTGIIPKSELEKFSILLAGAGLPHIPAGDLGQSIVMDGAVTYIVFSKDDVNITWWTKSGWGDYSSLQDVDSAIDRLTSTFLNQELKN